MVLKKKGTKLKSGGKIVFVVPNEKKNKYKENDINFHLHTWSEMNIGNLFTHAGYKVLKVEEIKYKWPSNFIKVRKFFGKELFNIILDSPNEA